MLRRYLDSMSPYVVLEDLPYLDKMSGAGTQQLTRQVCTNTASPTLMTSLVGGFIPRSLQSDAR